MLALMYQCGSVFLRLILTNRKGSRDYVSHQLVETYGTWSIRSMMFALLHCASPCIL